MISVFDIALLRSDSRSSLSPSDRVHAMTENYVEQNRAAWTRFAADYVANAERNWATDEVSWGIFDIPEADVGMLPPDLAGKDAIELGCGTAYVSAWLARRGAKPIGIDITP